MSRIIFSIVIAVRMAGLVFTLQAHAQDLDQFEIGKRAHDTNNFVIAFKILKPLAEQGHAEAQLIIADMYNIGKGVQQDNSLAIYWYRKSATQGNLDAIQMLGQGMRLLGESSAK